MLTCKQTTLLVSMSYDRRLSWRERLGVRLHLLVCDACRRFARQMRFLRQATRRLTRERADVNEQVRLSVEARKRIARALNQYE